MSTSANTTTLPRKPLPVGAAAGWIAVIAITIIFCLPEVGIDADFGEFFSNLGRASGNLNSLLHPNWEYWKEPLPALYETVAMAIVATTAGAIVSLPISFLASRVTTPSAGVVGVVRVLLSVLRSIPDLLFASLFVTMLSVGALPGILALFFFTIGIIVKLTSEVIDAVDTGPLEAALSTGATWPQADRVSVLPQILPNFTSILLYVFEINLRASAVLGLVGAGGLGAEISLQRKFFHYDNISIIVLEILVIVLLLEAISSQLRRRLS